MVDAELDGHALGVCFREMGDFLRRLWRESAQAIPEEERVAIKARFAELWQRCNAKAAEYEIHMKDAGLA
jgi:hypothetical protein